MWKKWPCKIWFIQHLLKNPMKICELDRRKRKKYKKRRTKYIRYKKTVLWAWLYNRATTTAPVQWLFIPWHYDDKAIITVHGLQQSNDRTFFPIILIFATFFNILHFSLLKCQLWLHDLLRASNICNHYKTGLYLIFVTCILSICFREFHKYGQNDFERLLSTLNAIVLKNGSKFI